MTADVIRLPRRGRPSNARLAEIEEQAADVRDELVATLAEDLDHARELLRLTRSALRAVALGHSPANDLVALEALIHRLTYQRASAAAALRSDELCPDGATSRHAAHGRAA